MLCIYSRRKRYNFKQESYYLNGKVIQTFYIPIFNSPPSLETTFALQTFFESSRVSESTEKSRRLAKKNVWGGSLGFLRNRGGVSSHRQNRGCDVVVGGAAMIRVFTRFSLRKTKETGRVSLSASKPAHGTNAGPVRFGPTRTRVAALVSAPHACSPLGLTCTAARLRQTPRLSFVKSHGSTWWLDWSAQQLGLAARYHYNISIPWFLALSKPFLPLVLPSEVSMVPNRQRQIVLGVYFDK